MTVTEDITLKLSEERNGLSLAAPVVRVVAKYLVEVALIEDAKMVKVEDILDLAREAWRSVRDVDLPDIHVRIIEAWLGLPVRPPKRVPVSTFTPDVMIKSEEKMHPR